MRVLYFAAVRERIGHAEEDVMLPPSVRTAADLIDWLRQRGPAHEEALRPGRGIRVALDRTHVALATEIGGAREAALFPPMTGG